MDWRKNSCEENKWAGVGHNPLIENPDRLDEVFIDTETMC